MVVITYVVCAAIAAYFVLSLMVIRLTASLVVYTSMTEVAIYCIAYNSLPNVDDYTGKIKVTHSLIKSELTASARMTGWETLSTVAINNLRDKAELVWDTYS